MGIWITQATVNILILTSYSVDDVVASLHNSDYEIPVFFFFFLMNEISLCVIKLSKLLSIELRFQGEIMNFHRDEENRVILSFSPSETSNCNTAGLPVLSTCSRECKLQGFFFSLENTIQPRSCHELVSISQYSYRLNCSTALQSI